MTSGGGFGFHAERARAAAKKAGEARAALRAQEMRSEIVLTLSSPGQGRIYQTGRKTKPHDTHQASAPGDAPAVDTGRLRQSIGVQRVGEGHYRVGTNVQYAPLLEFGTRRMAARPFIRPSLEKVRARVRR